MKKILLYAVTALLSVALAGCNDEIELPDVPQQVPTVESVSIAADAPVSLDLDEIFMIWSTPIELVGDGVSVNGTPVAARAANKHLFVSLENIDLQYATTYTVSVPHTAIMNKGTGQMAADYSFSFTTEAAPVVVPDVPAKVDFTIDEAPNASGTAARTLYDYLKSQFGTKCLSSTMAEVNWNIDNAEWVAAQTGKYPAMTCFDLIQYTRRGTGYDTWVDYNALTDNAIAWAADGGIVSLMWHWLDPSRETDAFYSSGEGTTTSFDVSKISDPSSAEYAAVIADIDEIATHLLKLKQAGVAVVWRPLHEAEGSPRYGAWFWWGAKGAEPCKALWRLMYDRLVNHHGLDNLLWVWTVSIDTGYDYNWYEDARTWYPGAEYVDIVGIDIYDDAAAHASHAELFKKTAMVADCRKIVALTETGYIPDAEKMAADGTVWAYYMPWYGDYTTAERYNGTYWQVSFASPSIVTRDQLPPLK